ncbi:hypothetical protein KKG41_01600 [Patescibacteria group bacterium]|nr:hypothetical protein [Patescibacteria group bacterium]
MQYTKIGQEEGFTIENIDTAISQLKWLEITAGLKLPFAQGEGLKVFCKEFKIIPSQIAYGGIDFESKNEGSLYFGFYGVKTRTGQKIFIGDNGCALTPLALTNKEAL